MAVTSHRAVVDGVELHWTERGAGSALVVLHGLGDSQHTWAVVTSELAKKYRVLGLDLPGCGLSGRPDATYGLDWHTRLTVGWLERIGLDRFDVLGHSFGGGVALWLLLYRARAVRKMALVAPGGLGTEVSPLLRLAASLGWLEAAGDALIGPITRLVLLRHGSSLGAADRHLLHTLNCCPGTARAFTRTVRDVINWSGQTRQLLQRIHEVEQLPSIALFWGDRDSVIPIEHGRALCTLLDNCSLWQLPGGGHFLHWQAPFALARALVAYLDGPDDACVRKLDRKPTAHSRRSPSAR